jgi:hypothetical protein
MSELKAEYVVVDEVADTDLTPEAAPVKRKPGRPRKEDAPQSASDAQADEVAQLAQDIASEAASIAVVSAMKEARTQADKLREEFSTYIKKQSELYAKPQNLCLHVKFNDLPTVKLKNRPAKCLPELILQAKIGQAGGQWPLLMGPTGSGKTVAAEQLADSLKLTFDHVNCSEGMSETWLWGRQTPNGFIPGGLWKAFKEGGVFLADEADAANDNVWLSMNTMLANGHAHNPICGETVSRHPNFMFVAAANTNGKGGTGAYTGRTRLDGATLNRFSLAEVDYDKDLEAELCPNAGLAKILWDIREKLEEKKSQDVISTRDMKNAALQFAAGMSIDRILAKLKLRMDKANHSLFEATTAKKSKKEQTDANQAAL